MLACVHTTPPPPRPLEEEAPSRFFLRGGGSVHRLFSVCAVISSMHSVTNTISSTPLLGPHSVYDLAEELHDEVAEKAIFHN